VTDRRHSRSRPGVRRRRGATGDDGRWSSRRISSERGHGAFRPPIRPRSPAKIGAQSPVQIPSRALSRASIRTPSRATTGSKNGFRAVERALTGTDDAVADIGDGAAATAEREELSTRLDDLEARVEELEAATQAIRGTSDRSGR